MEFSYPGVYTKAEKAGKTAPVGISTSVYAPIGYTPEGVANVLNSAESFPEFEAKSGGLSRKGKLATSVFNFFQNGGKIVKWVRIIGAGALASESFITEDVSAEVVTVLPAPDGVVVDFVFALSNALNKTPIAPSTLSFTDGTIVWTDDGVGGLTSSGGDSGTIDYETGEGTVHYLVAPAIATVFNATYEYKSFSFLMDWEGDKGDEFRILISGSDAYETPETASFSKYVLQVARQTDDPSVYEVIETFDPVVFDDSTDENYVVDVINDEDGGSDYLSMEAHNLVTPDGLTGIQQLNEVVVNVPVYDASERSFAYTLAEKPNPLSLAMTFGFAIAGEVVAGPTIASQVYSDTLAELPDLTHLGTVTINVTTSGGAEVYTNSVALGILVGSLGGTGAIDADGNYTIDAGGGNTVSAVAGTADYTAGVVIVDDGNGNLSKESGYADWLLDPNGANSIDYDTGLMNITWRYLTNPIVGPALGTTNYATYYAQPIYALKSFDMSGGSDGASITRTDIISASLKLEKKGIYALNQSDDMMMVDIPDFNTEYRTCIDGLAYCDEQWNLGKMNRFFMFAIPEGYTDSEAVNWKKNKVGSNSFVGAVFYPFVTIQDPIDNKSVQFPPVGHVAGITARQDGARNVSEPAAGLDATIEYSTGLERTLSEEEVGKCNLANVNCLIQWANTGRVLWGNRTLEIGGDYTYIIQTRTMMYTGLKLRAMLYKYVFKSNTAGTRQKVKNEADNLLNDLYRAGYYAGNSPAEAYLNQCDDLNNPPSEVKKGVLRLDTGIAVKSPSEFVFAALRQKLLSN